LPEALPRFVALSLAPVVLIQVGWLDIDGVGAVPWLQRSIAVLLVLVPAGTWYAFGLRGPQGRDGGWASCSRRLGPILLALCGADLLSVLVQEFFLYEPELRTTPLDWLAVVLVAGLLMAVLVGAVWIAVRRDDRFGPRTRLGFVYGAEVILVLLLVHLRL